MSSIERIVVSPPTSDARRERIERQVFAKLAAIRAAERADAVARAPRHRSPPRWQLVAAGGLALAAAVALLVASTRRDHPRGPSLASSPSLIVTPVGGASRFTVGDAIVDAGSDTSLAVTTGSADAVTLALARGSVDCEVAPRHGRPPFRVVAGRVTVEVVGTRFAVTRADDRVRVDVTHGKVRVVGPEGERFVAAGESWSSDAAKQAAAPAPPAADTAEVVPPAPAPALEDATPAAPAPAAPTPPSSARAAFEAAQKLEPRDPAAAARAYRSVANGKDAWAALALYSLAELDSGRAHPDAALAEVDEYQRRFPRGAHAEDAAWLRVEVLRQAGRGDAASRAALDYLRRFPAGTYARPAERLAAHARP